MLLFSYRQVLGNPLRFNGGSHRYDLRKFLARIFGSGLVYFI